MKKLGLLGLLTVAVLSATEIPTLGKTKTNHKPLTMVTLNALSEVVQNKDNDTRQLGWWYGCHTDDYRMYHDKLRDEFEKEDYFSTSYSKFLKDVEKGRANTEKTFMYETTLSLGKYNFKENYFPLNYNSSELKFVEKQYLAYVVTKFDNYSLNDQRIYMDKKSAKNFRDSIEKAAKAKRYKGLPVKMRYTFDIIDAKVASNDIKTVKKEESTICDSFRIDAKAHLAKIEFTNLKDEPLGTVEYK